MTARSDACTVTGSGAGYPAGAAGAGTTMRRMSFIELAPLPSAVPCARLHAVHVLREWDLRDLADDAALLISELVTNAVAASAVLPDRPPVSLRLIADGGPSASKCRTTARPTSARRLRAATTPSTAAA